MHSKSIFQDPECGGRRIRALGHHRLYETLPQKSQINVLNTEELLTKYSSEEACYLAQRPVE